MKPIDRQNYKKRRLGQYYTNVFNPFSLTSFLEWDYIDTLREDIVLEPFAGANNIIKNLHDVGLGMLFSSYDINPRRENIAYRDTFKNFPMGYSACITNPPWLYKSSAKRRGLFYPETHYEDLYQYALNLCLQHCKYVAALVPASFLNSALFRDRLSRYILLQRKVFTDTDNPTCLALFTPHISNDISIYYDDEYIGELSKLEQFLPKKNHKSNLKVNDENGSLGFIGIDGTIEASMRFCHGDELRKYRIRQSSRSITRIGGVEVTERDIKELNDHLAEFREKTNDVFLTPFKGLRKDGRYRRRMDFTLLKRIVAQNLIE